jgi:hypothetical protein
MLNPFATATNIQLAWVASWMKAANEMARMSQNLCAQQMKLLDGPKFQRCKDVAFRGADLCDHYGKRTHDVDVEKDL